MAKLDACSSKRTRLGWALVAACAVCGCTGTDENTARATTEAGSDAGPRDDREGDGNGTDDARDDKSIDGTFDASADERDVRDTEPRDGPADTHSEMPDQEAAPPDGIAPDATRDVADSDTGPLGPIDYDHTCGAGLTMRVTVLDDYTIRFHYIRGTAQTERGWIADTQQFSGPVALSVNQSDPATLILTTNFLAVDVSGPTCAIRVRDRSANVLWQEAAPFVADGTGQVSLGRKLDPGERIYGLGEKTGASDRRGRSFEMWNSDPAWSDATGQYRTVTDPIYQSHPFFLSVRSGGHTTGAFLANTNRTRFDVGKTVQDALAMSAVAGDVDLFFFYGPAPGPILERYTKLVGRPFLPPLWTLGYHQSRWSYTPATRVEEVASEFRKRSLPADGIWLDIDYMDGFRDFTWNPSTFPDPAGLMSRLSASGFKVTAILDPGIKSEPGGQYAAYNRGIAEGRFILGADQNPVVREVWPGAAVFPDFTSDGTRKWWGDWVGDFAAKGLRGVWIDMNEPAVFTKDGFPLDARVSGEGTPTTFAEAQNVYALLMARATREGLLRSAPQRRPFILTRAGFAGVQRYAAVWTGDAQSTWDHLAMTPAMLSGMSASGVSFVGSDIGGFGGAPAPELYGRWFELGSLSPFFRSHVATGAPDQEPWSFGPEVEGVARRMLALRYTLLPYWYNAHATAARTGVPVLRPLWFEFPSDEESHKHEDEFFIGPWLLAAPVTSANVTTRDVYLPSGTYYDYYTGARYQGGSPVQMPAPLGRIPLFVRAGAVLPTQDVVDYVGAPSNGKLYLDVFPASGMSSTTELYDDDGETTAHASGAFATTTVTSSATSSGLTLDIAAPSGAFKTAATAIIVRVHGVPSAPSGVLVDGAAATLGYDVSTRVVTVPAVAPGALHTVVVKYDATVQAVPRQVNLDWTLTLPASTPAGDIYVATSARTWNPDGLKLTRTGNTATGRLTVLEGTLVKWKATRGTWATVEVAATCGDLANRELVADYGTTGTTPVPSAVAAWVDHCP